VDSVLAVLYQPDAATFVLRPGGVLRAVARALGRNPSPALGRVVRRALQRMGGRRVTVRKACWSGLRARAVPRLEALAASIGLRRWLRDHWPATRRIPFVSAAPLPPGTPALDSPGFRSLSRDWHRRLRESGFRDLEGTEDLDWGPGVVCLDGTPAAAVHDGLELMATRRALDRHAGSFDDWAGLPPLARRLYVLLTACDWDLCTAARQLGITRHRAEIWVREIRERLTRRPT
jgi:hypothetical protein